MGNPIPNIHSPSLDSPSPSSLDKDLDNLPLTDLFKRKENLESELSALGSVLDSHGVNMRTTLTTFDGYPRDDVDIAQIRTTRARIIHLRNDHKTVLSHIEKGLHAHFAAISAASAALDVPATSTSTSTSTNTNTATSTSTQATSSQPPSNPTTAPTTAGVPSEHRTGPPFATVNSVQPHSPASEAGLLAGDRIRKFGEADYFNNEKLALVARVVGRSEGRGLGVVVLRVRREGGTGDEEGGEGGGDGNRSGHNEEVVNLTLVPKSGWGGRGLLGCHLLPL